MFLPSPLPYLFIPLSLLSRLSCVFSLVFLPLYLFPHDQVLQNSGWLIRNNVTNFQLHIVSDRKPLPQGDGVLIFDEVQVVCRLMWNSLCQKIIKLAMSPDDLVSLQYICQLIECDAKTQQTSYILQFLWRDLKSGFDVMGPYFTPSKTFENKTILSCWKACVIFMFMDSKQVYCCVMQPPLSPQLKLLVVLVEHMDSRPILLIHIKSSILSASI